MQYIYFNDTGKTQTIHGASATDEGFIDPATHIVVEIPDNTIPFIKVWPHVVLLSYMEQDNGI